MSAEDAYTAASAKWLAAISRAQNRYAENLDNLFAARDAVLAAIRALPETEHPHGDEHA